jgi:DnaJ-class molecular chaperone
MVDETFDPYDEDYFRDLDADDEKCSLCKGTGTINALTNQDIVFVANYADCPHCDGTGFIQ